MTAPTLPGLDAAMREEPRPGSRAARLGLPMSVTVLKEMCAEYGVCLRPVSLRRTDLHTGQTELIDIPCGSTREDKCGPCAKPRSAKAGTGTTNRCPDPPRPPTSNAA